MKTLLPLLFLGIVLMPASGLAQTAASASWSLRTTGVPVIAGNIVANTIDTNAASANIVGFGWRAFTDTSFAGLLLGASGFKSWPADSTTSQANATFTGIVTGTGRNATRYIEFTFAPKAGFNLSVSNISVLLTESGPSTNINAVVGYSSDGVSFTAFNANGVTGNALPPNTPTTFTATPALSVQNGKSMTVRIILWRKANSTASNSSVYVGPVEFTGTTTPATDVNDMMTPANSFALKQNYPNPFNPRTVISYRLSYATNVNLSVFDAYGNIIKTLVNETQQTGEHSAAFHAADLSSGVYYYRLTADSYSKTGSMLLLK